MRVSFQKLLLSFIVSLPLLASGQGCSDAGFCTINSFMPDDTSNIKLNNKIKVSGSLGKADKSISTVAFNLEYVRQLNAKLKFDARLSALSQNGNAISVFGFSDAYFTINYSFVERAAFTAGVKLPLSDGNRKENGLALPMDYQSSLGTFDIILGFSYNWNRLQLVTALQQPLSQNKNEFVAGNYPANSPLRNFQSTSQFERSGDILFRISYPFVLGNKFTLTTSLLPIYHLQNDKYKNVAGREIEIPGSRGLTLNGNIFLDYSINSSNALQLIAGAPFIVRETRPDGLTRSFVLNLEYIFRF